jgi:hypothetical protein
MSSKVQRYDELEFFKITRLNFHGKVKDWYKNLEPTLADRNEMKVGMQQKIQNVNVDEL